MPDHALPICQKKYETDNAPDNCVGCDRVGDERLMRPVLRVGNILSRTIRRSGPRGPPEERSHLTRSRLICERAAWNRILVASLCKHVCVVSRKILDSFGARRADSETACRSIIGIRAHLFFETRAQSRLLLNRERSVVARAGFLRPTIEHESSFAVQPVSS